MFKQITIILLHVTFAALQAVTSSEDESDPSIAASAAAAALSDIASEPPASSSEPSTVPSMSVTSSPVVEEAATMWSIDILNYSAVCSLYDNNVYYLSSAKENVKLAYHYLVARLFSLLTLTPGTSDSSPESENHVFLSRLNWSALTYHLYSLQTVLFRTETIAFVCIVIILVLFLHSLLHYRERNRSATEGEYPLSSSATTAAAAPSSKSYTLISKMVHCLNFTILFTHFFALVDGLLPFRGLRGSESITIQNSHGHAAVYSLQGRRPNMEDTFTLKNNIAKELGIDYYAVYDGHGGQSAAICAEKEIFDGVSKRIKEILAESNKENVESASSPNTCSATQSPSKSVPSSKTNPESPSCSASPSPASIFTSHKSSPAAKCALNRFDSITVNAMKNILHEEITKLDKRLVDEFRKKSDISGSTAIIAIRLVHPNILLVANVGDSRAILCDWKGATIPLSFDHKPYQLKEYRRIVEAGGYIMLKGVYRVNGILAVSRALGDYPLKEDRLVIPDPDILSFDLNELKPKFMVAASDGFWDTFSNDDAVRFVRQELVRYTPNYAESQANLALYIAKKLVNEAYTRESYDNITVIVVLFEEPPAGAAGASSVKIGQAKASPTKAKPLSSSAS